MAAIWNSIVGDANTSMVVVWEGWKMTEGLSRQIGCLKDVARKCGSVATRVTISSLSRENRQGVDNEVILVHKTPISRYPTHPRRSRRIQFPRGEFRAYGRHNEFAEIAKQQDLSQTLGHIVPHGYVCALEVQGEYNRVVAASGLMVLEICRQRTFGMAADWIGDMSLHFKMGGPPVGREPVGMAAIMATFGSIISPPPHLRTAPYLHNSRIHYLQHAGCGSNGTYLWPLVPLLPCIKGTHNQGISRHPANVALLSLQSAAGLQDYAPPSPGRLPRNIIQIILSFADYEKSEWEIFKWMSDRIAIRAELCHEVYLAVENLITIDVARPDYPITEMAPITQFLHEANNRLEDRSRALVHCCWGTAINLPMLSEYGKKVQEMNVRHRFGYDGHRFDRPDHSGNPSDLAPVIITEVAFDPMAEFEV
jgi:hypothetical protein